MITIQIYKGKGTQPWYLRFVAENGQTILDGSEGYYSKWNAKRAALKWVKEGEVQLRELN